ncbi:EF-hand calcium-binding domain-containing protein 7 [Manacus vitellinus]|uniref:EF-hand calcium-binding domain-containing protein 7 n=1 Tax=Manacus vitellinus TaxID=328815 RepID=A0A093PIL3_9PASS|nr:EF-hand calcium-binding domain-containing protein 7 [Manacus vitellinus]
MASSPRNNSVQKATQAEYSQGKKSQHTEEANFYLNCRAAYLTVLKSSLENIKSREQLSLVLQQAGRNPSQKTINKYWTSQTTALNFDDFCAILKQEKPVTKTELLEAFGKIDTDKTGYILHDELYKILTTRGDKMTWAEVNAITKQADFNCSGKLDYSKFCELYLSTREQSCRTARERLEVDSRLRQQQFGNQAETSSEGIPLPVPKPSPRISKKTDHKLPKADSRAPSRPSSAQSGKASTCPAVSVGSSSNRSTKLIEPDTMKSGSCPKSGALCFNHRNNSCHKHCFLFGILHRCVDNFSSNLNCSSRRSCHWLSVDTALFILKENETQENLQLVSFTEVQNKEMFGWKGELGSGNYWLLPFTTGCRLRKGRTQVTEEAKLVYRDEDGELALTKDFRAALLDIFETIDLDGNGLLSLEEYNFFELRTSGEKCDEEAWAVCKENFEMKKNELTRQGFLDLNLMEAMDREGDPSDLWVTLLSLGYNKALEMTEACPFVIDIYSERCKPRIKAMYLEAGGSQLSRAVCRAVVNKGEPKVLDGSENTVVHTYKSGRRITSVIENKSENKVIIHVNNEQSKNCLNNRGLTVFAVEVAPKSMMVCQHVVPLNEQEEWIYNCVHSLVR